jgi:hypothetical protein
VGAMLRLSVLGGGGGGTLFLKKYVCSKNSRTTTAALPLKSRVGCCVITGRGLVDLRIPMLFFIQPYCVLLSSNENYPMSRKGALTASFFKVLTEQRIAIGIGGSEKYVR